MTTFHKTSSTGFGSSTDISSTIEADFSAPASETLFVDERTNKKDYVSRKFVMQREAAEPNLLLKARLLHKEVFEKLMFPLLK